MVSRRRTRPCERHKHPPAVLVNAAGARNTRKSSRAILENALKQISVDDGDPLPFRTKITKLDLTSRRRRFPLGKDCEVKSSGSNDENV